MSNREDVHVDRGSASSARAARVGPTTPILFPSGEDANPMNRRLPAEVVTRRRREVKREEKPIDEVQVDVKVALSMKPEKRLKWLLTALKMAEDGRASATDVYDIVSNRKFASGLPWRIGRKARTIVQENLELFSDKQRRYLRSDDWALIANFEDRADAAGDRDGDDDKDDRDDDRPIADHPACAVAAEADTDGRPEREDKETRPQEIGGVWTVAEDSSARQRAQTLEQTRRATKDRALKDVFQREEQERRQVKEAEETKRRALEDEVDNSLMLLERLGQQKRAPSPSFSLGSGDERDRDHRDRGNDRDRRRGQKRGGLSRSRSISVGSSVSRSRGRRRKRSRDRGRREGNKRQRVEFEDALRRRMQQRESEVDSARIPVVDPGHAKRWK